MDSLEQALSHKVTEFLTSAYDLSDPKLEFQATRKDFEGDVTLVLFPLLKLTRQNPKVLGEKIGNYLGLEDYISFEKDRLINDTIYPADSLDILRDFRWQPSRSLDDFLPETIEWYREHLDHFRHRI